MEEDEKIAGESWQADANERVHKRKQRRSGDKREQRMTCDLS